MDKQREKLIELIEDALASWDRYLDDCAFEQQAVSFTFEQMFADHLLANGVIVPPCKVGQIVYLFFPVRKGIYEAVVDEISFLKKSNFIVTRDLYFNRRTAIFFEQFGKTVFLSREDAEKALEKRKEK